MLVLLIMHFTDDKTIFKIVFNKDGKFSIITKNVNVEPSYGNYR